MKILFRPLFLGLFVFWVFFPFLSIIIWSVAAGWRFPWKSAGNRGPPASAPCWWRGSRWCGGCRSAAPRTHPDRGQEAHHCPVARHRNIACLAPDSAFAPPKKSTYQGTVMNTNCQTIVQPDAPPLISIIKNNISSWSIVRFGIWSIWCCNHVACLRTCVRAWRVFSIL